MQAIYYQKQNKNPSHMYAVLICDVLFHNSSDNFAKICNIG